ncbi:MAG: DUF4249 domain-containing protein [Bacteroidota bacterium]
MIRKILHIVVLALLTAACTEKIDIKLDNTYTRLVVDGNIESDTGAYSVTLTKSADYFSNEPVPKVVNAAVWINDGMDTYLMHETKTGFSGIYETDPDFAGHKGNTYTLHVELPEAIAGKSSFEASSYLPSVTHLDSIRAVFNPDIGKKGIWTIKLWTQEPGNEINFYLFNLYKNGHLLTDTITKKVISDDKFFNGSYMNGVVVMYINNDHQWETLHIGDTVMLQMSGITKEYYDFIDEIKQSGFNIPFFSGPPANAKGNVNNGGVGFFAAYSNSYAKTIVK